MKFYKRDIQFLKPALVILLFCIVFPLRAQYEQFDNMPQFLFPKFMKSTINMKAGKDLTLMLNYNTVTELIVFIQRDQIFDLVNPETVDTAIIAGRKFVPVEKVFHEVLLTGPLNLYVEHKGNLVEPGKPAAYGGTSQVSSSTYLTGITMKGGAVFNMKLSEDIIVKVDPIHWIRIDKDKFSFVNERQFLKVFPKREKEIKAYIKENHLKFEKQDDVIKLVQFCSGLVK
jgi:hypothetical protein